jgi:hypothetical protein
MNRSGCLAGQLLKHDRASNRIEVTALVAKRELARADTVDQARHHGINLPEMRNRLALRRRRKSCHRAKYTMRPRATRERATLYLSRCRRVLPLLRPRFLAT